MKLPRLPLALVALLTTTPACDDATEVGPATGDEATPGAGETTGDDLDLPVGTADGDEGKLGFGAVGRTDDKGKADGVLNTPGPAANAGAADTEVWKVTAQWADKDTPAARKAGMAWPADSGLTWDEKYGLWIDAMEAAQATDGYTTYSFVTPYGKTLPAPAVECAETAILLRATFASWYGLPFMLQGSDETGKRIYLGHFGFRTADARWQNTPLFKTRYTDYSGRASTWQTAGWPQDAALRKRHLGGSQDDAQPALGPDASAGTWFDEAFLNKRVGHFMIFALSYFGSVNLSDPVNTFNLAPGAIREGDVLVERWQRRGIGHTLVVKEVENIAADALAVELVSGSMPRRQAKWENPASSRHYFLVDYTGGPGDSGEDGLPYAALGGGLKRWRTPVLVNGRWVNAVPVADREDFIDATDHTAIGARLATFETLLRDVPPEEKRGVLLGQIADARAHLEKHPASCSARERREAAFEELYDFESEHFGRPRSAVDDEVRTLADAVFAPLVYDQSKTCCFNSTTENMAQIVMAYAEKEQAEAEAAGLCVTPTVFRWEETGYGRWVDFAATIGRADQWVTWREDEPCPQRDVTADTLAESGATPFCTP
jgi:hypothetical protein